MQNAKSHSSPDLPESPTLRLFGAWRFLAAACLLWTSLVVMMHPARSSPEAPWWLSLPVSVFGFLLFAFGLALLIRLVIEGVRENT